jgi:hypothetical protein
MEPCAHGDGCSPAAFHLPAKPALAPATPLSHPHRPILQLHGQRSRPCRLGQARPAALAQRRPAAWGAWRLRGAGLPASPAAACDPAPTCRWLATPVAKKLRPPPASGRLPPRARAAPLTRPARAGRRAVRRLQRRLRPRSPRGWRPSRLRPRAAGGGAWHAQACSPLLPRARPAGCVPWSWHRRAVCVGRLGKLCAGGCASFARGDGLSPAPSEGRV